MDDTYLEMAYEDRYDDLSNLEDLHGLDWNEANDHEADCWGDEGEETGEFEDPDDHDGYGDYDDGMDGDFDSAMASAGHGTDEDYGCYGGYGEEW